MVAKLDDGERVGAAVHVLRRQPDGAQDVHPDDDARRGAQLFHVEQVRLVGGQHDADDALEQPHFRVALPHQRALLTRDLLPAEQAVRLKPGVLEHPLQRLVQHVAAFHVRRVVGVRPHDGFGCFDGSQLLLDGLLLRVGAGVVRVVAVAQHRRGGVVHFGLPDAGHFDDDVSVGASGGACPCAGHGAVGLLRPGVIVRNDDFVHMHHEAVRVVASGLRRPMLVL